MSTQETALPNFFSSHDFSHYTYDPANDPAAEFERLCIAKQWSQAKRKQTFEEPLEALPREARNPAVTDFFRKYECFQFIHNPFADPEAEFDRLQEARELGGKKLNITRREFQVALNGGAEAGLPTGGVILERPPIVHFLKGSEYSGYTYRSGRPEEEFKRLVKAHWDFWDAEERKAGGAEAGYGTRERWKASAVFTELQEGFYESVEEQFDLMLDKIAGGTKLRRDEVLVELYGVGKAPLPKAEAKIALKSVHVNIFDFLEVAGATINAATEHEKQNLIQLLSPGARALSFPNDAMLVIYSMCMDRVFPRDLANRVGALISLLRLASRYFGDFKRVFDEFRSEAGGDIDQAKKKGPGAMRELLLSREWESLRGVRAVPAVPHASLHSSLG